MGKYSNFVKTYLFVKKNIIGVDLGTTSGRVILAKVGSGSFSYEEIHHFGVDPDITKLYWEILSGLMMMGDMGVKVDSIGVDASSRDLPESINYLLTGLKKTTKPGAIIGMLRKEIGDECGIGLVKVVSVPVNDIVPALTVVPAEDENFAYLNLGTKGVFGIETASPIDSLEAKDESFTNEEGLNGASYFYKNISGMWILERCMKEWELKGKKYTYDSIARLMTKTRECISLIDVDDPIFVSPQSMLKAIEEYCIEHRLSIPNTDAMVIRCIFDSLVLKYAQTMKKLESFSPFPINRLHIIGVSSKNDFLNQQTANALNMPVIVGPAEATSIGNIMTQAKALNIVESIWDIRDYVKNTVPTAIFLPE